MLVSACLIGRYCRYDGRTNEDRVLERELEREHQRAVPFCPEEHGGLGTPRPPASIHGGDAHAVLDGRAQVRSDSGADLSPAFLAGARGALEVCREHGIRRAYLKERSPSCGVRNTHADGELVPGPGVTSALLARAGIDVRGIEGRRD
ncbi:MAG: DUF523 domain-containing protein [Planctomycetes bacterium]|nr:DUF523 domain-containing protein [Planctomycetota bacterium]